MTLAETLREHLTCTHPLSLSVTVTGTTAKMSVTHAGGTRASVVRGADVTALGSAIFHACANAIAGDGPHAHVDMAITDQEYAGFAVNA